RHCPVLPPFPTRRSSDLGRSHVMHFCSAHPTTEARGDRPYRDLLNAGDLNLPDGAAVAWAARVNGAPAKRFSGTEGFRGVVHWGDRKSTRLNSSHSQMSY